MKNGAPWVQPLHQSEKYNSITNHGGKRQPFDEYIITWANCSCSLLTKPPISNVWEQACGEFMPPWGAWAFPYWSIREVLGGTSEKDKRREVRAPSFYLYLLMLLSFTKMSFYTRHVFFAVIIMLAIPQVVFAEYGGEIKLKPGTTQTISLNSYWSSVMNEAIFDS